MSLLSSVYSHSPIASGLWTTSPPLAEVTVMPEHFQLLSSTTPSSAVKAAEQHSCLSQADSKSSTEHHEEYPMYTPLRNKPNSSPSNRNKNLIAEWPERKNWALFKFSVLGLTNVPILLTQIGQHLMLQELKALLPNTKPLQTTVPTASKTSLSYTQFIKEHHTYIV